MLFVLFRPQLPQNLGAVLRVLSNFNQEDIAIIDPCFDLKDPHVLSIVTSVSAHGSYLLQNLKVFQSLEEALIGYNSVWGTTAVEREMIQQYQTPRSFAENFYSCEKTALIFGPERTGLSNEELSLCTGVVTIPVSEKNSSLNLSHAVGILAYELFLAKTQSTPQKFLHYGQTQPASFDQKAYFLKSLEESLDQTHFWRTKSQKPLMRRSLQAIFSRMDITEQELKSLHGVVQALFKKNP